MTAVPLAFLHAAHAAAQREAENARGQWVDVGLPFSAVAHAERHSPDAALRRIAAERKVIAEHKTVRVLAWDTGWDEQCDVCHVRNEWLPCSTIKHLAEAWGWTEETP